MDLMSESNPLYTDRIIIRAAVPIAMPMALIAEIMLITLCDFLAKRYLPAMNGASLICHFFRVRFSDFVDLGLVGKSLLLQQFLYMLHIVEGTVKVERNFRNNAELLADLSAKLAAQCSSVLFQCTHYSFSLV